MDKVILFSMHGFELTLFEAFYYFWWWAIVGWFLEVIVRTLETGAFENRGFLNGPYCPIYGVGVLGAIILFNQLDLMDHVVILYFLAVFLCSSLELLVGVILMKLFHAKWWDYSHEKFNYKGYICLKISLLWGVGCITVIKVIQPLVETAVNYIPPTFGNIMAGVVMAIIISDIVATLSEIKNFNYSLKQMDQIAEILHVKSINLGENISDEVIALKAKYEKLLEQTKHQARIIKAFPTMTSIKYNDTLKLIKERLNIKK